MSVRLKKILIFISIISTVLQGCASAPMASVENDSLAKSFNVPNNKSNLYVYRNENFGAALSMDIFINNYLVGQTAAKTYFKFELDPGKYQVKSRAENESILDIILIAGENIYIWQEVKMGIITGRTKLSNVDIKTGQKGVLESKLIATSISESDLKPFNALEDKNQNELSKLKDFKKMLDQGLINEQDYEVAKSKMLRGK